MTTPTRIRAALGICLTGLLGSSLTMGEDDKALPPGVEDYMTYHLGRWQASRTYFDREGKPGRQAVEGYGEEVLVDGQVNLHYSYSADGAVNTAFRYYNPQDDKLYMVDVTSKGALWVLSGKRGEDIFYSDEKPLSDGRKLILRFTHTNVRPGAFEATSELSFDGGTTWRKHAHSLYQKIGDRAERSVTLSGDFVWTGAGESGGGDLEASFTPTGPEAWDVTFRFEWRGTRYEYAGTATGGLTEGKLAGRVKNEDQTRNFTFEGAFEDGVFRGTHTEVGRGRPDRIEHTGTMRLKR